MSCKKHPGDHSSRVGVCASCLRERLFALIAAQAQLQQPRLPRGTIPAASALEDARNSDSHPPPLLFPRSVSPYVARRQSDDTSWSHQFRFYSTPQMGPTSTFTPSRSFAKKHPRFSLLSNLFRSRSEKLNPDPGISLREASPSWFSTIFSAPRKKQSKPCSVEYSNAVGRKHRLRVDRGMSPARGVDSDEDCENCERFVSGSGYCSESSQGWKKSPVAPAGIRRGKQGHARNVSGLAFCLSPLVRASPSRQWNHKPPDLGLSGDVRVAVKPHISTAASFCANRSRKLVDLGRVNQKR